ncbi:LAG1-domain-containing protein [Athelia psychrophila]|uniref:LAG1-domain-containing protein n=1 Tax=Athelia psychrophila TaxID=1759441 RepID=A0A167XKE5_9AGAM|nr:LAG1-domain-containing protein [Fibularhizoctonia sp. CBS 109695]
MGWYESPTSPIAARRKGQATSKNDLWSDIMTLRWAVEPSSSFKLLLIPVVLYVSWELLAPYIAQDLPNPFAPLMFISHHIPTSPTSDPRYAKGYLDLLFLAYYVIFFSFVRQIVTVTIFRRIGKYFGLRKRAKLDRYGEQGYAMVYFGVMSLWGIRIMSQHPTWWFNTEYYWINYPHWDMQPELKCYYLMQASHWIQELLVLVMGLEKPRKDYAEFVAHHIVTIWLIGWSYLVNMTLIGNAVFLSMDLPDIFLASSKLLNYMRYDRAKSVSFAILVVSWTYFRIWKNLVILWSVWFQFDLMPDQSKQWLPEAGVWMVWWMKYQIFFPIFMLQLLNCFWYFLILRIMIR